MVVSGHLEDVTGEFGNLLVVDEVLLEATIDGLSLAGLQDIGNGGNGPHVVGHADENQSLVDEISLALPGRRSVPNLVREEEHPWVGAACVRSLC